MAQAKYLIGENQFRTNNAIKEKNETIAQA